MKPRDLRYIILTADLACMGLSMLLAYLIRYGFVWHGPPDSSAFIFVPPLMAALLLWSIMSSWAQLDGFRSGWRLPAVVSQLLLGVSGLVGALFTLAYMAHHFVSRLVLGCFGLFLFLGFLLVRVIARSILASRFAEGFIRNTVIVGNGTLAREMVSKIESHPESLRRIVGFLVPGEARFQSASSAVSRETVILRTPDIAEMLKAQRVDEVILTMPTPAHPELLDLTSQCRRQGIAVSMVPQPYDLYLTKPELVDLDGLPLLEMLAVPLGSPEPFWKRWFDLSMTLGLLPVCILPMLLGAAIIKLKGRRAFCSERRCGKHGEEFELYRLNSPRGAPGLAFYERMLQRFSITELPQLLNVLRGEMSLVGPRPEGSDRAGHYTDWHRQRLNAKPGITGLAQVYGLRNQHSSEDKTRYDLQYILHRSPFQDISLLLQTAWILVIRLVHAGGPELIEDSTETGKVTLRFQEHLIHAHSSQSSAD